MAKSYTTLRNLFGSLTKDVSSANLTLGDQFINDGTRLVLGNKPWWFLNKTSTLSTVASQQFYQLPADFEKLNSVTVTIGTTKYVPREAPSREFWDILNQSSSVTSDIPEWFFVFNGQLGFYPTPSSSTTDAITYVYKRSVKDLSIADYTTGTITSLTNGASAVVGSGTSWTVPMAGRYLRITDSDSASKGDGFWYEISSVTSSTALTLVKPYNGVTLSGAAAAYTIGQMPILPEAYHMLPVHYATWQYWVQNDDLNRAKTYENLYGIMLKQMQNDEGEKSDSPVVDDGMRRYDYIKNPNLFYNI